MGPCRANLLRENLLVHRIAAGAPGGARSAANSLRGYIDGLTPEVVAGIVERIRREKVERIYLDGSNLGLLAGAVKGQLPKVEVLTFFHNVEARFFLGSFRRRRSVRALGVLIANWIAERSAVAHSDRLIALSARDSRLLARLYGRSATDILPMAMEEQLAQPLDAAQTACNGDYVLFVG